MSYDLNGLLAGLIFVGMGGVALLLMIVALPIRFVGKNKVWFVKLSMCAITFFVIGLAGVSVLWICDGSYSSKAFRKLMDEIFGWVALVIALGVSVFIFMKKPSSPE